MDKQSDKKIEQTPKLWCRDASDRCQLVIISHPWTCPDQSISVCTTINFEPTCSDYGCYLTTELGIVKHRLRNSCTVGHRSRSFPRLLVSWRPRDFRVSFCVIRGNGSASIQQSSWRRGYLVTGLHRSCNNSLTWCTSLVLFLYRFEMSQTDHF